MFLQSTPLRRFSAGLRRRGFYPSVVAATIFVLLLAGATSRAVAANIITFDTNLTSCGGSTMCSTNGTIGYTGTHDFNLSTLSQWFQIDPDGISHLAGQVAEPNGGAGAFRVVNDTNATITSYSIVLINTFSSGTPSVTFCSGSSGPRCDNFQANKGAGLPGTAGEGLSGADFFSCTNGATGHGFPCFSTAGQAAANFSNNAPQQVIFNWTGLNITPGTEFDISFSSWNNTAFAVAVPEPASLLLLGTGLLGLTGIVRNWSRKKVAWD